MNSVTKTVKRMIAKLNIQDNLRSAAQVMFIERHLGA